MAIKICLIIIGSILLICGIAFIIKKIGGSGNNKVKVLGFEFETTNGTSALLLFFGFTLIVIGARLDSGVKQEPVVVQKNDSAFIFTAFHLGQGLSEFVCYDYKYNKLRPNSGFNLSMIPNYDSKIGLASAQLKELEVDVDPARIDFSTFLFPELHQGGINDVAGLIEAKKGPTVSNAFLLGYVFSILDWRCLQKQFSELKDLGRYQFTITHINQAASLLSLPKFHFVESPDDTSDDEVYMDLRVKFDDYVQEIENELPRVKYKAN
jgi:hypothetical protein